MRYELSEFEWAAIKPMPPNKPRGYRNEPLPGNVHDELWNLMVGRLHLKEELAEGPIEATGAGCQDKLIQDQRGDDRRRGGRAPRS
jgi:hypothetical protein